MSHLTGHSLGACFLWRRGFVQEWTSSAPARRRFGQRGALLATASGPLGKRAVLGLERGLARREDLDRAVEDLTIVGGHHARPQQRAGGWHGRMDRDVHIDPRVIQGLPQEHRLPIVADNHRDDGSDHLAAVGQPCWLYDPETQRAQAGVEVARVVEHAGEQLAPLGAGTADAVNMNGRDWIRRKSTTSAGPAITPPQLASDFEKVAILRSTRSSTPNSSAVPAPRSPSTPSAWASSTISRAPKRSHNSAISGSGATSPSIENTPSTTTSTPPPSSAAFSSVRSSRSIRLWRNARSFARDKMQPSRIEAWSPESATTVSLGPRIVPSAPRFAWWPVVNTSAASVSSQSASSRSSSRCRSIVPFRKRDPVSPVP